MSLTTGKLFAYTNNIIGIESILDIFTTICYDLGTDSTMYQTYGEMNRLKHPPLGYHHSSNSNIYLQNCKLSQKIPLEKICISYYY